MVTNTALAACLPRSPAAFADTHLYKCPDSDNRPLVTEMASSTGDAPERTPLGAVENDHFPWAPAPVANPGSHHSCRPDLPWSFLKYVNP